jgi:uncharacterized protein
MENSWNSPHAITAEQAEEVQRTFITKVYGWMMGGLMITGIISLLTLQVPGLLELIFSSRLAFVGLMILQLGLVVWLSARVGTMTASTATMVFLGYSALTGVTLSVVFLAFTRTSIASTFFVTAGTFGAMAFIGYVTKRDLTGLGSFLTMGVIGLVLASIVNMFLNNPTVYWITTFVGILIFVGLTAYDTQKIKLMSALALEGGEAEQKGAIVGALRLYLDFINLFLLLLRVLGNRR